MDELELLERISTGENFHTEFKATLPNNRELSKDITCFANTDGGEIFVGVNDAGEIVGISEHEVERYMLTIDDVAYNRCRPPITVLLESVKTKDGTVLVIRIPKGNQRPYCTSSGQYYIRSGTRCRQASREELLRLFQASESIYYDEMTVGNTSLEDLDMPFFMNFIEKHLQVRPREEEVDNYLKNLHLIDGEKRMTLAGLLFFGKNPQDYLPNQKVICAFIKGTDISVPPSDQKEITGKIPEMLENTQRFLQLYLTEEHKIRGFEREKLFEIPEVALREAVVNAIAHRDYTIDAPIRVIIFKNRVEVRTPGKLPNTVTIESMKIGGSHVLRNPTIYNLLSKMGLVTDLGSGVRRMIQIVREHLKKDVILEEIEHEFVVKIPRKSS